jgi:hypothetical protein
VNVETVVRTYFSGEKFESALILLAGVACLAGALWAWIWVRQPFARGFAAPLLLTACLGLTVGGSIYFRTDTQVRRLLELQERDPGRFAAQETLRMREVLRSFGGYRLGYLAAIVLALACQFAERPAFRGLAAGLLLLAALGLTVDQFAEARAAHYVKSLQSVGALPPR